MAEDIAEVLNQERNHKQLSEEDVKRLKRENAVIRRELANDLPESDIFGQGCLEYFDESDLANVDGIIKIHVHAGQMIDAIQMEYRHSGKAGHHGGQRGRFSIFSLEPGERIIIVKGTLSFNVVRSLTFITDCGREETFGQPFGEPFNYETTGGSYLAAIKGYNFYDISGNACKSCPQFPREKIELLPAVGFIAKFQTYSI